MIKTENNEAISSTVIMIGYVIGAVTLPLANISYLVLSLAGKKIRTVIPRWLILSNVFFLLVLIFYIFYLNDPDYNQK